MVVLHPDEPLRLCVIQLDVIPQALEEGYWAPAEPLLSVDRRRFRMTNRDVGDEDISEHSVARLSQEATSPELKAMSRQVQDVATGALDARLREVLTYVTDLGADVIVLPEYAVPITALPTLVEYSTGSVVAAGLGYVRNQKEADFLCTGAMGDVDAARLTGRNVSVLVADRSVHLYTKRFRAASEHAKEGDGPFVIRVRLHGREVRVGLAVCLDFLRGEEEVRQQGAEIVCIPAYSGSVAPFSPDAPRDHVRLFANNATAGGSTIMAPGLDPPLCTRLGVLPIQRGREAVVVVDYSGYPTRPAALNNPRNRLVQRAEIVERSAENEVVLNALREIRRVAAIDEPDRWRIVEELIAVVGAREGPLRDALRAYGGLVSQDIHDERLLDLACEHLEVEAGRRPSAVRGRQIAHILDRLRGRVLLDDGVGTAYDLYSRLARIFPTPDKESAQQPASADDGPRNPPPTVQSPPASPPPAPPEEGSTVDRASSREKPVSNVGRRAVLIVDPSDPPSVRGAGCLIEDGAVLTVGHLIGDERHVMVVRRDRDRFWAEVRWRRQGPDLDIAILSGASGDASVLQWGRLIRNDAGMDCEVVRVEWDGVCIRPVPVRGVLSRAPDSAGWYDITVGDPPLTTADTGAPVVCADRFVGLVCGPPMRVLAADAIVRAAWQDGVLRSTVLDAVEIVALECPATEPVVANPLFDRLSRWAASTGLRAGLMVSTGAGSERIVAAFAARQRRAGWAAVRLPSEKLAAVRDVVLESFALFLVIIDVSPGDADTIVDFLREASRRCGARTIRVLLLSDATGDWWDALMNAERGPSPFTAEVLYDPR